MNLPAIRAEALRRFDELHAASKRRSLSEAEAEALDNSVTVLHGVSAAEALIGVRP